MTKEQFKVLMNLMIRAFNKNNSNEFYVVIIDKEPNGEHETKVIASPDRCPAHFAVAVASLATTQAKDIMKLLTNEKASMEFISDDPNDLLDAMPPPKPGEKGS